MSDEFGAWVVLLTTGTALFVVAFLLLDSAVWYVQYGVFAAALLVLLFAVSRAERAST